ncbi:probable transporter Mch4p [Diutina catenulata]
MTRHNQVETPIPLKTFSSNPAVHFTRTVSTETIGTSDDRATGYHGGMVVEGSSKHPTITQRRRGKDEDESEEKTTDLMYGKELDPNAFPDGGTEAYLVLFGSFCGLFTAFGVSNSAGAIESYVKSHQLKDVDQTSISWVFSLHLAILYFGGVVFGPLFDKFGARKPLLVGTILSTVGLVLTAQSTRLVHFVLSFGLLTALGCSIMMSPTVGAISHWFLRKRAMAASLATMGGLVAGSVFGAVLPKLYESIGFAWAIRTMALICFVCSAVSVYFVRAREIVKPEYKSSDLESSADATETPPSQFSKFVDFFRSLMDISVLTNKQFVLLAAASGFAEVVCMSTLTYLPSYAYNHGTPFTQANLLITIVNVCGIPARIASGYMADRWGRFNVMFVTSVFSTIVIFALWFPAKGSLAFLYVFGVLFGIFTSAIVSLIPACAGQICSADKFGKVYGTLYFILAFVMMIGMYLASVVISHGSKVDYAHLVLYEGALGAASVVFWLLARWSVVGWKWCKF